MLDSIHPLELRKLFAGEGRAIIGNQLFRKAQCCKAAPIFAMVTAVVEELVMCTSIHFEWESGQGTCAPRKVLHNPHAPEPRAFGAIPMGVMVLMVGSCDTLGRAHIGLLVLQGQHLGQATAHTVGPGTSFLLYLGDQHVVGPGPFLEDLAAQ